MADPEAETPATDAPPATPPGISTTRVLLTVAARTALGGIFLVTGLAKLSDPVGFLFALRGFRLLPGPAEAFLAIVLPWLEFLLGLLLILGLLRRTAALMTAALNLFFAAAILSVMVRGIEIDCGCFGLLADLLPIPDGADGVAVARNLVFAAVATALARPRNAAFCLEDYLARETGRDPAPAGPA